MGKLMSWACREVLIKAVAQAIPPYAMSVFKFSTDLCHSIQFAINRFSGVASKTTGKLTGLGAPNVTLLYQRIGWWSWLWRHGYLY